MIEESVNENYEISPCLMHKHQRLKKKRRIWKAEF